MTTRNTQIKIDTVAPSVDPVVPTRDGLNDWFVTGPVSVSELARMVFRAWKTRRCP